MSLNPIGRFILHIFLWLIPAFMLWWVALDSVILPSLQVVVAKTTAKWFHREQAVLKNSPNKHEWIVNTHLLTKEQPEDKHRRRTLNFHVPLVVTHTLGFPILWAWFLATPHRRIINQIVGNISIFTLVAIALWLKVFLSMARMMASSDTEQVMITPNFSQAIQAYPEWLITFLSPVQSLLAYMAVGVAVPIIWTILNRQFIAVLLLSSQIQKGNGIVDN